MVPTVRDKQERAQSCPYTRPLGTCRVCLSPLSASPGSEHGSPGKPRTCLSSARPAGGSLSLRREPRKSCAAGRQVSRAPPGAVLPAPEPQPRQPGGGGQRPRPGRAAWVGRVEAAVPRDHGPHHVTQNENGEAELKWGCLAWGSHSGLAHSCHPRLGLGSGDSRGHGCVRVTPTPLPPRAHRAGKGLGFRCE